MDEKLLFTHFTGFICKNTRSKKARVIRSREMAAVNNRFEKNMGYIVWSVVAIHSKTHHPHTTLMSTLIPKFIHVKICGLLK